MFGEKAILFLLGLIVLLSSLIGIAFSLGYTITFISFLPSNPLLYFGINAILGLGAIILSFRRRFYY